ncbi:MAG: Cys-Gln thioester bond-forming surface protein [Bacilli bacterium]|nr:Cys-Gln thioester bond-forming surface protein [Bacilli bacterium]
MKSLFKKLSIIIVTLLVFIGGNYGVKAVSNTIHLADAKAVPRYIDGLKFSIKRMTNGEYLYCLHRNANTAQNVTAKLDGRTDNGVSYILANGYPVKSITGNRTKDYYITQTAVWWYLDDAKGASNLSREFKSQSGTMINHIKRLVRGAKKAGSPRRTANIKLTTKSTEMILKDGYYVSEVIKGNATDNYKVTVSGPAGTKVVDLNGNVKNTFKPKEGFRVKVPLSEAKKENVKVTAKTTATYYQAYRYYPTDKSMQKVARLVKESNSKASNLGLTISKSVLRVNKLDEDTKQNIAGATIALKDASGKTITTWVSTSDTHIIQNLQNGTYTIEEVNAPDGYKKSETTKTFTINDKVRDVTINLYNKAEESVVTITKVDKETNAPLAGAVLVVKDANGTEIERFTTTTEAHVIKDLEAGTYTVEEVEAPAGYMKNETGVEFTIDSEHLTHQITIENYKEVVVPDTSTASTIILTILGIVITIVGLNFIKRYA